MKIESIRASRKMVEPGVSAWVASAELDNGKWCTVFLMDHGFEYYLTSRDVYNVFAGNDELMDGEFPDASYFGDEVENAGEYTPIFDKLTDIMDNCF